MRRRKLRRIWLIALPLLMASPAPAAGKAQQLSLPGIGPISLMPQGRGCTVELPAWGPEEFFGRYVSARDFELHASLPIAPLAGQAVEAYRLFRFIGADRLPLKLSPLGAATLLTLEGRDLEIWSGLCKDLALPDRGLWISLGEVFPDLAIQALTFEGQLGNGAVSGHLSAELRIAGRRHRISATGDLGFDWLVGVLRASLLPLADARADLAAEAAAREMDQAQTRGEEAARLLFREAKNGAGAAAESSGRGSSLRHGRHSKGTCLDRCVPDYAELRRTPLLEGANRSVDEYLRLVRPPLLRLEGGSAVASSTLRFEHLRMTWTSLLTHLDAAWEEVLRDDSVESFFFLEASEREGRAKYERLIQEAWDQHRRYRDQELRRLLGAPCSGMRRNRKTAEQALDEARRYAEAGIPLAIFLGEADLAWDLFRNQAGLAPNGSRIGFWRPTGGSNQQWLLVPAGGEGLYHLRSVENGRYLHLENAIDAAGNPLVIWDGASAQAPQTCFLLSADTQGRVSFSSARGLPLVLEGGRPENGRALVLGGNAPEAAGSFFLYPARAILPPSSR